MCVFLLEKCTVQGLEIAVFFIDKELIGNISVLVIKIVKKLRRKVIKRVGYVNSRELAYHVIP